MPMSHFIKIHPLVLEQNHAPETERRRQKDRQTQSVSSVLPHFVHIVQRTHNHDSPLKHQLTNAIWGNNCCLFWESYNTHKYMLQANWRVIDCYSTCFIKFTLVLKKLPWHILVNDGHMLLNTRNFIRGYIMNIHTVLQIHYGGFTSYTKIKLIPHQREIFRFNKFKRRRSAHARIKNIFLRIRPSGIN
jgi:hypothetical protein